MPEADPVEERRVDVGRLRLRPDVHDALEDRERAERDDEERQPDAADQDAVDARADQRLRSGRCSTIASHAGTPTSLKSFAEDDAGEREQRADRQVDAAGEHHERHAHRDDPEDRDAREQVLDVGVGEEVRLADARSRRTARRGGRTPRRSDCRPTRRPRPDRARGRRRRVCVRFMRCSWWPPAKWAMRASVASSRVSAGDDPAAEHDEDAVAEREQLGDLGRGDEDRRSLARPPRTAAGRSRPSRRRRRRGSARRASAPSGSWSATSRARPSAGCRRRASRPGARGEWVWIRSSRDHPLRRRALARRRGRREPGDPRRWTPSSGSRARSSPARAPARLRSAGTKATPSPHRVLRPAVA